jgi:hypothetical protein
MLTEMNPEDLEVNSWSTQKKLVVPGRKHSEAIKEEKCIPLKKTSNNSVISRSTQSSYGSNKMISEKSYYAMQQ